MRVRKGRPPDHGCALYHGRALPSTAVRALARSMRALARLCALYHGHPLLPRHAVPRLRFYRRRPANVKEIAANCSLGREYRCQFIYCVYAINELTPIFRGAEERRSP
jgi:hypothetical protein